MTLRQAELKEMQVADRLELAWKQWLAGAITLEERIAAEEDAMRMCRVVMMLLVVGED